MSPLLLRRFSVQAALFVLLAVAGCQSIHRQEFALRYDAIKESSFRGAPRGVSGESFSGAISRVWKTHFFEDNPSVEAEIQNNDYEVFDGTRSQASRAASACFSRKEGRRDILLLRVDLFAHFEIPVQGEIMRTNVGRKELAILVHEFAHDFWSNILDEPRRLLFSLEAAEFLAETSLARTKEQKLDFLRQTGLRAPREADFEPYEEMLADLQGYSMGAGQDRELYASLADLAFQQRIVIPQQLRIFYFGVVSQEFLAKTRA